MKRKRTKVKRCQYKNNLKPRMFSDLKDYLDSEYTNIYIYK